MHCGSLSAAGLAAAVLVCGAASGASAATMTCTGGSGGSAATYSLSDATAASCFTGNDTNQIDSNFSLFGMTGWVLADKNDGPDGDGAITFTDAPTNGDKSGDWTISSITGLLNVAITLNAGNGFGAFLLDLDDLTPLSGTWTSSKGLSHASIYYNGTVSAVPLPAALPLLLAAIGGLAFVGRRRRA